MKKIEIGNGLMVKILEDANEIKVFNIFPFPHIEWCDDLRNFDSVVLPKGTWSILSLKSEMTEEKARKVVNQTTVNKRVLYLNYTDTEYWYKKALESFNSFCTANNLKGEYVVLIKK